MTDSGFIEIPTPIPLCDSAAAQTIINRFATVDSRQNMGLKSNVQYRIVDMTITAVLSMLLIIVIAALVVLLGQTYRQSKKFNRVSNRLQK